MTMAPALAGTGTVPTMVNPALHPEDVDFNAPPGWHRVKHHLVGALERTGNQYTLEDVAEEITSGAAQFWPGEDCAVVTRIIRYPQKTVLLYWLAGGDLQEMQSTLEELIENDARDRGATEAIIHGRKGFQKALKGWTELSTNLTKGL